MEGISPWVLCPSGRSFFFRNGGIGKDGHRSCGWKTWLCTTWVKRSGYTWGRYIFLTQCNSYRRSATRESIRSPVWRSPTTPRRTACQTNSRYRRTGVGAGCTAECIDRTVSFSCHHHFLSFFFIATAAATATAAEPIPTTDPHPPLEASVSPSVGASVICPSGASVGVSAG